MRLNILILTAGVALLAGCASTKTAEIGTDLLAAGAGGVIADKTSHGNPYWTLAGGVAGLGAAEWARSTSNSDQQKQLGLAYDRGKAQNAQLTYDAIQNAQKDGRNASASGDDYLEIPITAPVRTINGVKINASNEFIRVSTR
ncbi:MAG TPA: hypothetical protein VG838_08665 [Opitutaceae bacterium]|nr:hypothetical protein [Opitutaceae bacterium]